MGRIPSWEVNWAATLKGESAFHELARLISKEDLKEMRESSEEFREKFAFQKRKLFLYHFVEEAAIFSCVACGTCLFNNIE